MRNSHEYDNLLDDISRIRLDENFSQELRAIEQWFGVLSDMEKTSALYSLLQNINYTQAKFLTWAIDNKFQIDRNPTPLGPVGSKPPGLALPQRRPTEIPQPPFLSETVSQSPTPQKSLFEDTNNYEQFGFRKPAQNSIQATLIRSRTPIEEAIAAANWTTQPSINPSSSALDLKNPHRRTQSLNTNLQTTNNVWAQPHSQDLNRHFSPAPMIPQSQNMMPQRSISPLSKTPLQFQRTMSPSISRGSSPLIPPTHQHHFSTGGTWAPEKTPASSRFVQHNLSDYSESTYESDTSYSRNSPPRTSADGSHKEKGKIPEHVDLELVKDIPGTLNHHFYEGG